MSLLELVVILEGSAALHRCHASCGGFVLAEDAVLLDGNLSIEDAVQTCDDAAGIVEGTGLLHVKVDESEVVLTAFGFILISLEDFDVDDDCMDRLRQECKQLFVETEDLADGSDWLKSDSVHVFGEYLRIGLEWRPVESFLLCFFH